MTSPTSSSKGTTITSTTSKIEPSARQAENSMDLAQALEHGDETPDSQDDFDQSCGHEGDAEDRIGRQGRRVSEVNISRPIRAELNEPDGDRGEHRHLPPGQGRPDLFRLRTAAQHPARPAQQGSANVQADDSGKRTENKGHHENASERQRVARRSAAQLDRGPGRRPPPSPAAPQDSSGLYRRSPGSWPLALSRWSRTGSRRTGQFPRFLWARRRRGRGLPPEVNRD